MVQQWLPPAGIGAAAPCRGIAANSCRMVVSAAAAAGAGGAPRKARESQPAPAAAASYPDGLGLAGTGTWVPDCGRWESVVGARTTLDLAARGSVSGRQRRSVRMPRLPAQRSQVSADGKVGQGSTGRPAVLAFRSPGRTPPALRRLHADCLVCQGLRPAGRGERAVGPGPAPGSTCRRRVHPHPACTTECSGGWREPRFRRGGRGQRRGGCGLGAAWLEPRSTAAAVRWRRTQAAAAPALPPGATAAKPPAPAPVRPRSAAGQC